MTPKLNKKLSLSRETVRELTDSQLDLAVGGSGDTIEACCLSQFCHTGTRPTFICNTLAPCYPPCH